MAIAPKKILYFHHAIGRGGAPRSLSFLIAGLDKGRFEPIVVIPKRPGNGHVRSLFLNAGATVIEEQDIRPFHGSTVAPYSQLKQKALAIWAYPKLVRCAKRIVQEQKPDLVHLNSTCLVAAAKGAHLAEPGIKTVAHVREPLLANRWGRNLAALNRKHVDHFIGIDQFGIDSLGIREEKGTVIFNFVDREKFSPADMTQRDLIREQNGWPSEKTVFLSLSRIEPYNGAAELAEFVQRSDSELNSDAFFAFAGFRDQLTKYGKRVKKIIDGSDRCQAIGFTEDVVQLINAADVIVAPFITPHSARSVFEAASIGKPALISGLPNLKELIVEGKTGLVFDWQDIISFVQAANRLCGSDRDDMSRAAFDFAEQEFDQTKNTEKTMQVYVDLIENTVR